MHFRDLLFAAVSCLAPLTAAQSSFTPARPPGIPLAVKSPYLNTIQFAGTGQNNTPAGNGGYLAGQWPAFWAGQITGWTGMVRVDRAIYTWMGAPNVSGVVPPLANQTSFSYTSTKSTFNFEVGGAIKMAVSFLSNVSPDDFVRQSLPYTYMNVQVESLDGAPHFVQLYTDITAEWVSGNRSNIVQWDYGVVTNPGKPDSGKREAEPEPEPEAEVEELPTPVLGERVDEGVLEARDNGDGPFQTYGYRVSYTGWTSAVRHSTTYRPQQTGYIPPYGRPSPTYKPTVTYPYNPPTNTPGGLAYHKVYRQTQQLFSEVGDQAEWGYWYYMTNNTAELTHQTGSDETVRGQFLSRGFLTNAQDTKYRAINDTFPVFGFALNLGFIGGSGWYQQNRNNGSTSSSTLFGISIAQQLAIQFEGAQGNVSLPSLWTSYFSNDLDAVSFYYNDYGTQLSMSNTFDNKISTDSIAAGGQDYLTVTSLAVRQAFGALEYAGTTSENYVFIKEISSDGNIQTVDMIFPFHPIALYLRPAMLKQMLDPLFINQEAGYWPFAYSIHDIGSAFPNATGHNDGNSEMQPLEECGNMIIMTLAYAQRTNDVAYLQKHYPILRQWNNYLVNDSLIPANQISTDDFAGSLVNQTNLALKGIIGIAAMAEIATLTGHDKDAANYTNISTTYIRQWQTLAIDRTANPPHTTLNYGNVSTYSLLYNLYADRELSLGLVPQYVYDMQSTFYPTVAQPFGIPLDTRHPYTKADWEAFVASIASTSTKTLVYRLLAQYINNSVSPYAFSDLYEATNASLPPDTTQFRSRPAVGGIFAALALNSSPQKPFLNGTYTPTSSTPSATPYSSSKSSSKTASTPSSSKSSSTPSSYKSSSSPASYKSSSSTKPTSSYRS